ncbi:hypothetical protein [Peristeroidobacter agariperforans]|uniref:hypothetical protein n=1 Tax=Peristeroidobacter agariperforans TaxID=268404 RepID=UPI0013007EA7|nr:hypothetical protein [Peristeroidobacter agariperforans]
MKTLSTLIDEDTNKVLIDGFYENVAPISKDVDAKRREIAAKVKLEEPVNVPLPTAD